jgi:triosephosphate isomerase
MRQPLVIGNWKMHGARRAIAALIGEIVPRLNDFPQTEVAVCPPFVWLPQVIEAVTGSRLRVGAQTVSEYSPGAYTGEVAAEMLAELGCRFAIVGHSERRQLFDETSAVVAAKAYTAHAHGLVPVICVGETLAERDAGATEQVIAQQLAPILSDANVSTLLNASVIAYEPVWAIGTGKTATPAQAQAVHAFIRAQIAAMSPTIASRIQILYGGSVKPTNAGELFAMADIDGGLIGGASLQAADFCAICAAAETTCQ